MDKIEALKDAALVVALILWAALLVGMTDFVQGGW